MFADAALISPHAVFSIAAQGESPLDSCFDDLDAGRFVCTFELFDFHDFDRV